MTVNLIAFRIMEADNKLKSGDKEVGETVKERERSRVSGKSKR